MQRAYRLRRDADFQRVRSTGRSWAHPLLVLYAAPGPGPRARVGFAVSRRLGKAVARNRVKRRLREAVRRRYPELAAAYDLMFVARPGAAAAGFGELASAVDQLLQRARLWRPGRSEESAAEP